MGMSAEVQAHILGCQACREDLEDLTVVWAKLGVLPEEQPGGAVLPVDCSIEGLVGADLAP